MKWITAALVMALAMVAAPAALAQRAPVPIIDRPAVSATTGSGKALSPEALGKAIVSGGAAGKRQWDVVPVGDGRSLRGTYRVRTHMVAVDIVPGQGTFSIKYADSADMKYAVEGGTPVIHPFYNRWVDELIESIRAELKKL